MRLSKYFLLPIWFLVPGSLYSQNYYIGTPKEIYNQMLGDAIANSIQSYVEVTSAKVVLSNQIREARERYWYEYSVGSISKETKNQYQKALLEKDMYYFSMKYIIKTMENMGLGIPDIAARFKAGDRLTGGELDRGHNRILDDALDRWINKVYQKQRQTNQTMISDINLIPSVIKKYPEEYIEYVQVRDYVEIWIDNEYSPLKLQEGEAFFKALIEFHRFNRHNIQFDDFFNDIKRYASEESFVKAAIHYKEHEIPSYDEGELYNYMENTGILTSLRPELEQTLKNKIISYVGAHDFDLLPISLLYLTKGWSFELSEEVNRRRVQKYGEENIRIALEVALKNKARCTIQACFDEVIRSISGIWGHYIDDYLAASLKFNPKSLFGSNELEQLFNGYGNSISFHEWQEQYFKYNDKEIFGKAFHFLKENRYQTHKRWTYAGDKGEKIDFDPADLFQYVGVWSREENTHLATAAYSLSHIFKGEVSTWKKSILGIQELDRMVREGGAETIEKIVGDFTNDYDHTQDKFVGTFFGRLNNKLFEAFPKNQSPESTNAVYKRKSTNASMSNSSVFTVTDEKEIGKNMGEQPILYSESDMRLKYQAHQLQRYYDSEKRKMIRYLIAYLIVELEHDESITSFNKRLNNLIYPLLSKIPVEEIGKDVRLGAVQCNIIIGDNTHGDISIKVSSNGFQSDINNRVDMLSQIGKPRPIR